MNITSKTILITGGGSGIGYEIAKLLGEKGNKVIITGRSEAKLKDAAVQLKNVTAIASDINNPQQIDNLLNRIDTEFGGLDILINNAGQAYAYKLDDGSDTTQKATEEIQTNYLSVISLVEKALPGLKAKKEAAIVNVSSILAFVPGLNVPTYSATKAALHSYTQILRYTLAQSTGIKVFELMPPLVNTGLSKDIGGENGIHPEVVAQVLINGFESDTYELHVGKTADIYKLYLSSPEAALNAINAGR